MMHRTSTRFLALLVATTFAGLAAAPTESAPMPQNRREIEVVTYDNQSLKASAVSIGADGVAHLEIPGSPSREIPCAEIVEIVFGELEVAPDFGWEAYLVSGDRAVGRVGSGPGEKLTLLETDAGALEFAFGDLASLRRRPLLEIPDASSAQAKQDVDRVYLAKDEARPASGPEKPRDPSKSSGGALVRIDSDEGILKSIEPGGVRLVSHVLGDREVVYPLEQVVRVDFASVRKTCQEPDELLAVVEGRKGARFTGHLRELREGKLRLGTLLAAPALPASTGPAPPASTGRRDGKEEPWEIDFPTESVASIYFKNGRVLYVSDLEPARVAQRKYLEDSDPFLFPYQRDRSVVWQRPLRLKGRQFRKGLGVHAYCELTYRLDGGFKRFLSTFGFDDEIAGMNQQYASVAFRVLGDGRVLFDSGRFTWKDPPREIDLAVDGLEELTLVVDPLEDDYILDRADWAGARLIR